MHVEKTKYSFPVSEIRLLMVVTLSCCTCLPVTPACCRIHRCFVASTAAINAAGKQRTGIIISVFFNYI